MLSRLGEAETVHHGAGRGSAFSPHYGTGARFAAADAAGAKLL